MLAKLTTISDGVDGLFVKNERFNTTLVSFNFYLPLNSNTVALYGLLPFILTTCSKDYPDFSALNFKLNRLYGAKLNASTEKFGDFQLLRMSISIINDKYTLDKESLIKDATELLLGLIFNPSVNNSAFIDEDLAREKRKAVEHIKGELTEKRLYAKNRLISEMYKDNVYGTPKCGTVEAVESITGEQLYNAWKDMLAYSYVKVQVVGAVVPPKLFEVISENFGTIKRDVNIDFTSTTATKETSTPKTIVENMEVKQAKLVMGFSSKLSGANDATIVLSVMNDIFGGGPYSRLFSVVREKMSLCYYCSAGVVRQKGLLTVDSGLEEQNVEKAEKEILNQLEIMKKGEFSDFEFDSSIKSITDSLNGYNDSQEMLDLWYSLKTNNDICSPEEMSEKIKKVTKEDVINAANGIKLNTVYKLLPKEVK